ncbi:MAG: efflux RND transporter permease subunit [Elusimicrobia bacterium]|nr:efflux RND transporter permease subunit [Elusimicrobiota bacterium]
MEKTLTPIFVFAAGLLLASRAAPRWALRRPALMGVLVAALTAWGLIALRGLPVELMPNAASETVTVSVAVRGGMAPTDVETLIVRPLESALGDLPRLKSLFSNAKKDRGAVTLDFHPGVDMKRVTAEVHERVDRALARLPSEIEKPVIAHFEENDAPVYIAAITSERLSSEEVRRLVDERIKDALLRAPGVANVEVGGGREGKILVELDRARLVAYRLSPHKVTALLGRRNVAVQVGSVESATRVAPVRVAGRFKGVGDIGKVVVGRDAGGGTILLENIAVVRDSYLEPESLSRLNGQAAVSLYIQKESGANTLRTVREVEKALDAAWRALPVDRGGLRRVVVSNQAQGITTAVVAVRVSLVCGVLLILLALCLFESERRSTQRVAGGALGFLLVLMVGGALFKVGDAPLEPLYLILLAVFLFTAFFDPDVRPGLIVAGSMPLSALFCFLLFQACGITLNVMSLFGLALGMGMLVDNATVVYENLTHKNLGPPGPAARERALAGTEEMVTPLIGATITNAIVFVPFLFLSKDIQDMFTDVAAAVGASLFASLGVSLTVVPLLTAGIPLRGAPRWPAVLIRWGEKAARAGGRLAGGWDYCKGKGASLVAAARGRIEKWGEWVAAMWRRRRSPALENLLPLELAGLFLLLFGGLWWAGGRGGAKAVFLAAAVATTAAGFMALRNYARHWPSVLRHRGAVLSAALLLAATSTLVLFKATERDFQTSGALDEFVVFVELSSGAKLDVSNAVVADIEGVLARDPEVAPAVLTAVSRIEGWSSKVYVTLVPRAERRWTTEQVRDLLREKLKNVGRDRDGNAFVHFSSPRTGQEIGVRLLGPDYAVLEELAQRVSSELGKIKGLADVKMRYRPGRPEVLAVVDQERAARAGLSTESVAETAHALMRGLRATLYRSGARQTETIVRLRQEDRANLDALADLPVLTRGGSVRLGEVASLRMSQMPNEIYRENKERFIEVTANREGLSLGRAAEEIQKALDRMEFPLEYRAVLEGGVRDMARALAQLTGGVLVMVFLVYLVLVVLFESLLEPLVIMSTVPLCLIGVAAGLILFGIPLTTGVLVGVMMLAGVVVNNAIMLLDHLNGRTDSRRPLGERLLEAARSRMRPIFLTAGSAVLGFLPMMLDTSEAGALWRPLAVAMVFGLLTSTVLTLFVTPALTYFLLEDLPRRLRVFFPEAKKPTAPTEPAVG